MTPYRRVHTTCREAQVVKAELPAGELEFDGQSLHKADPADALYFPATHAVQIPPSGPVDPVLQVQFFKAALPAGDLAFDGQPLHVPAPQSVQLPLLAADLYLPSTHAVHVPVQASPP